MGLVKIDSPYLLSCRPIDASRWALIPRLGTPFFHMLCKQYEDTVQFVVSTQMLRHVPLVATLMLIPFLQACYAANEGN